jgi:HK97 gp10 family phage protein
MINFEVKLSGDMTAALDRYEKRIKQQALLSGVAKAAEIVYEEVKLNAVRGGPKAPDRQSGDLLAAVYRAYLPERSTDEKKTYIVAARNKGAFYWRFLEFGTSRMPAQPFIRPSASAIPRALDAGKARMAQRLREG